MRATSLVFLINDRHEVLLGRKKRGMGVGKWNGFGGKIEQGENMRACAARELYEESGLIANPNDLKLAADIYFDQPSDRSWSHPGIVYLLYRWKGILRASDEMEPKWFPLASLPYEEMWKADCIWVPLIFSGKQIKGTIIFDSDGDTVLDAKFREDILMEYD